MIEDRLRTYLTSLSDGFQPRGSSPFSISKTCKPKIEGPFGLLFHEAVVRPSGCNGSYIHSPELVQDIAGELLGENYDMLVSRFRDETDPCVVHFMGKPTARTLCSALLYAHQTNVEMRDSTEVANSATTCFDGEGKPVLPQMILKIECLSEQV